MSENYSAIKSRLREYLNKRGITITNHKPPRIKCVNPGHGEDKNPTAILYENQETPTIHCPKCLYTYSIFEVCGALDNIPDNKETFPEKLKSIQDTLGIMEMPEIKTEHKKKSKSAPVSLPLKQARKIYNTDFILKKGIELRYGTEITGSWKYTDAENKVVALDVRFEGADVKKSVITFWYDGKNLRWSNPPVLIYNLYEVLNNEKPIIIVEGAKCAELARHLTYFTPCSWSGGSGKVDIVQWPNLEGREIFILPDDDIPGIKCAKSIKARYPQAKIIKPPEGSRKIKPQGADIEEALQIMLADELTAYILNPDNILESFEDGTAKDIISPDNISDGTPPPPDAVSSSEPFKILGIGDDGRGNFIDQWGYYQRMNLDSLSKGKLNYLADLSFWEVEYTSGKNINWDEAINFLICKSKNKTFDKSLLRGRGAWHDGDKISYHDGVKTFGEYDDKKIYLKLPRIDMGLESKPADIELINEIKDLIFQLSFATPADAVRCMGWSVIAPFAGALQYRPTILLTGLSSTGKSKVQELILQRLTRFIWADMRTTSTAGVRGRVGHDNAVVFFEEAGKETEKMKLNFEDILAFIRSNYTENSPDSFKGTKEGGYINYKMNSIFGIASTDPTIENVQDENRIIRINFVKPKHKSEDWQKIENNLKRLLSEENCNRIRSLAWSKLKIINSLTEKVVHYSKTKTNRDYRSSYADSLLATSFMVIWNCTDNPTDEQIDNMLEKYYQFQPQDENRDESTETIDRLMDELIEILHGHKREKITIMECLSRIYKEHIFIDDEMTVIDDPKEIIIYKQHLGRYGIKIFPDGKIAIASNHHAIKKIIQKGDGYSKIFMRYKGFIENKVVGFPGDTSRYSSIIDGVMNNEVS